MADHSQLLFRIRASRGRIKPGKSFTMGASNIFLRKNEILDVLVIDTDVVVQIGLFCGAYCKPRGSPRDGFILALLCCIASRGMASMIIIYRIL